MEKTVVYMINLFCTDEATYGVWETVGVSTDPVIAQTLLTAAKEQYPGEKLQIEEVFANQLL